MVADVYPVKIGVEVLSDSHYSLTINDRKVMEGYSPLYFMRHSTKRSGYNRGVELLDVSEYITSGLNEISIINNISAPVKPIGVSGSFVVLGGNEKVYRIPFEDFRWDITKGVLRSGVYNMLSNKISVKNITIDEIDKRYSVSKDDISEIAGINAVFVSPDFDQNNLTSLMSPVDIYLLVYLVLVLFIGLFVQRIKSVSIY